MVQKITMRQALGVYQAQLESMMARMSPVERRLKMVGPVVNGRQIYLTYEERIREVMNGTQIGQQAALEYINQLEDPKGDPMYIVEG